MYGPQLVPRGLQSIDGCDPCPQGSISSELCAVLMTIGAMRMSSECPHESVWTMEGPQGRPRLAMCQPDCQLA